MFRWTQNASAEDPPPEAERHGVGAVSRTQLLEHPTQVGLHGGRGDVEVARDLIVRHAPSGTLEHGLLARAELRRRRDRTMVPHQCGEGGMVHGLLSVAHRADRVHELLDRRRRHEQTVTSGVDRGAQECRVVIVHERDHRNRARRRCRHQLGQGRLADRSGHHHVEATLRKDRRQRVS